MNATINAGQPKAGTVITGKSLKDIQAKMKGMLKVEGPRGLTATADNGATIHTELYDGQDYIKTAAGKILK